MNHAALALAGIRIVDLTEHVAGPYCTMLLAGLGADVVKVEPPGGESGRRVAPFAGDREDIEGSLRFLHLNRAKRSVVLDASSQQGRASLRELVASADALILDEAAPRALSAWGATVEHLRGRNPALTVVSVPPFAAGGPWRDWLGTELILAAASSSASCTGDPDRAPLKAGGYLSLIAQGQTAAVVTLAALLTSRREGVGSDIEVAGAEASAEMLAQWTGGRHQRMPRLGRLHQTNYPWQCYRARDGWVGVQSGPSPWEKFCDLIGASELAEYVTRDSRLEARERIDAVIERWLASMGKVEAYHAGQSARFGFGYVASVEDLMKSAQLAARGFFRVIDHPAAARAVYPGPPFALASGWHDARAPLLGEHTEEVLAELASPRARTVLPAAARAGDDRVRPLHGTRVLDLTQIWAGPRATMTLADLGAEVIKIESPARAGPARAASGGEATSERELHRRSGQENLHRGKKHITLDLSSELGQSAFRQLVEVTDVVIANFAAGVLERLGASFEALESINPRIIVISMSGFGDSGPERDYVAYGVAQEQLCGIYGITGYEGEEPLKSGFNVGDPMNGMHGAAAVIAALIERERTGRGQYVDFSQFESTIPFIGEALLDFAVNGRVAAPAGNSDGTWAPHCIYPTRDDDGWVAIVARDGEEWRRALDVLGAGDLAADARFRHIRDRVLNHVQLDSEFAMLTRGWDRDELAARLQEAGVPAAPVLHTDEVWQHPQFLGSGFVQRLSHPDGDEYFYLGPMWRINGRRPPISGPAPLVGEHNEDVLGSLTRLTRDEIAALGR